MSQAYDELIKRESLHWGSVRPDPENPQIWDDPKLYEIFFGKEYLYCVKRIVASGPEVLELGCGEGNLAIELATRGLNVTAIDLSPERIQRAREKAKMLTSQPGFQVSDLNQTSLPVSTFDCVVANGSLHHILALDRLLEQVHQTLKPHGKLIVFDFIGMGVFRKLLAAFLYAVLPTYKPYKAKWHLKSRMKSFLAGEQKKREAIAAQDQSALHPATPFEEISGKSIIDGILKRFRIINIFTTLPFWFYLAAKIKMPSFLRYPTAMFFRSFDNFLVRSRFVKGAYFFVEAERI